MLSAKNSSKRNVGKADPLHSVSPRRFSCRERLDAWRASFTFDETDETDETDEKDEIDQIDETDFSPETRVCPYFPIFGDTR